MEDDPYITIGGLRRGGRKEQRFLGWKRKNGSTMEGREKTSKMLSDPDKKKDRVEKA